MARPVTEASTYKQITLRLPQEMIRIFQEEAQKIGRPFNTHLLWLLEPLAKAAAEKHGQGRRSRGAKASSLPLP